MFYHRKKNESTELAEYGEKKKNNAWKKYGALVMAGVLLAGTAAGTGVLSRADSVRAEESSEISLNIADGGDQTSETAKPEEASAQTEARLTLKTADEEEEQTETKAQDEQKEEETDTETATEEDTEEDAAAEEKKSTTGTEIAPVETGEGSIVTTDVSAVVENSMPSIVSITNKSVEEVETYFYGTQEFEAESTASGIIVAQNDEELLIATNSHVVDGANELSVGFTADAEQPEDLIVPAKIKGMDKSYELAVVAVQLSDIKEEIRDQLRIAELGSSGDLKVGEAAIAIGNALGYGQSVTCGIISALDREVQIDNFSKELILTDAAINYGNSGGALLNSKGQVIGINVAKEVADAAEGMGYSIPIDTAIPVLSELINKETRDRLENSERGYMGATVVNVSSDAKELYNMPEGAFVYEVTEGSAAEAAGIKKGDVITKFGGETVQSSDDLIDKMGYYAVGETVTVEVQTANSGEYEAREVEVTLQEGTAEAADETEEAGQQPQEEGGDGSYMVPEDGSSSGWEGFFDALPFDYGEGNMY